MDVGDAPHAQSDGSRMRPRDPPGRWSTRVRRRQRCGRRQRRSPGPCHGPHLARGLARAADRTVRHRSSARAGHLRTRFGQFDGADRAPRGRVRDLAPRMAARRAPGCRCDREHAVVRPRPGPVEAGPHARRRPATEWDSTHVLGEPADRPIRSHTGATDFWRLPSPRAARGLVRGCTAWCEARGDGRARQRNPRALGLWSPVAPRLIGVAGILCDPTKFRSC
jgi:hypothetical protein